MNFSKLIFALAICLVLNIQLFAFGQPELPIDGVWEYSDIPGLVLYTFQNGSMGVLENNVFTPVSVKIIPGKMSHVSQVLSSPDEVVYGTNPNTVLRFWDLKTNTVRIWNQPGRLSHAFYDRSGNLKYNIDLKTTHIGSWEGDEFKIVEMAKPFWTDYQGSIGIGKDTKADRHMNKVFSKSEDNSIMEICLELEDGTYFVEYDNTIYLWDRTNKTVKVLLPPDLTQPKGDGTFATTLFKDDILYFVHYQKIYSYDWKNDNLTMVKDLSKWYSQYGLFVNRIDFKSPKEYLVYSTASGYKFSSHWVTHDKIYKINESRFLGRIDNNYVAFRK